MLTSHAWLGLTPCTGARRGWSGEPLVWGHTCVLPRPPRCRHVLSPSLCSSHAGSRNFSYSKLTSSLPPQTFAYTVLWAHAPLAVSTSHAFLLPLSRSSGHVAFPGPPQARSPLQMILSTCFLLPLAHFHFTSPVTASCQGPGPVLVLGTPSGYERDKNPHPHGA